MKTVDLNKVLEMLINEEQNEATGLLHEWFVERSKQIHEELMSEDNTLSQDIEDDQEAIESEEFYGEADEDTDAEGEEELDGDVDAGDEIEGDDTDGEMEGPEDLSPEAAIGDTIEDLEAVMARLKAEFAEITGADVAGDEVAGDDMDNEFGDEVGDDAEVDEAFDASANDHVFTRQEASFSKQASAQYQQGTEEGEFNSFHLDGGQDVEAGWILSSSTIGMSPEEIASEIAKILHLNPTAKADKVGKIQLANGKSAVYAAFVIGGDQMGESDVVESADDFDDLEESWTLEPVKDPNLQGGKEIGADGAKVNLNDKSPLPEHDADARVGGKAVEIKSDHHEGHEREASPEVKGRPLLKNQVKKATDGRTKVSKEGDKSATLNSKAGFGSDSPKSPIGQATDLRGSDFKRK